MYSKTNSDPVDVILALSLMGGGGGAQGVGGWAGGSHSAGGGGGGWGFSYTAMPKFCWSKKKKCYLWPVDHTNCPQAESFNIDAHSLQPINIIPR